MLKQTLPRWSSLDESRHQELVSRTLELLELVDEYPAPTVRIRQGLLWVVEVSYHQVWQALTEGVEAGYYISEKRSGKLYWRLG